MNIVQSLYAESILIIFISSALLVDRFLGKKFISLLSLPLPLKLSIYDSLCHLWLLFYDYQ